MLQDLGTDEPSIETVIDEQYELTMSSILTAVNLGASFKTKILIF